MRKCRVCGKRVKLNLLPIKVVIRASLFDRRKMWFHPDCFFKDEQLVKQLIANCNKEA